jgi:lipid-binding SYLF domain-containing protein
MNADLLTYSRSKGAFAGLTLEGAVVEQDADSNHCHLRQGCTFPQSPDGRCHPAICVRTIHGSGRDGWP